MLKKFINAILVTLILFFLAFATAVKAKEPVNDIPAGSMVIVEWQLNDNGEYFVCDTKSGSFNCKTLAQLIPSGRTIIRVDMMPRSANTQPFLYVYWK